MNNQTLRLLLALVLLGLSSACSGASFDDDDDSAANDDDAAGDDDDAAGDDDDAVGDDDDAVGDDDDAVGDDDDSAGSELPRTIVVNELLASNDATNTDENGDYDDWVELLNIGTKTVDLTGWTMADDPDEEEPWSLPSGLTLGAGEFLLIWADKEEEQGDLHASFKLSGDGETVILWDSTGAVHEQVDFGTQDTDVSWARIPDGTGDFVQQTTPSPGASNGS
jgi:hypothetical protein